MSQLYTITINRDGDKYVTSYDVWAKSGSYPSEEGDGVFVGNAPIAPHETSASITFARSGPTWYFAAMSVYGRDPGVFSR